MNTAKLRAIRDNATVSMVFATNSYEIRNAGEAVLKSTTLPAGVTIPEALFNAATRFSFNGSGIPVEGEGHVYMTNTKHNFRGISLSRVGTARIQTSTSLGGPWTNVDS
jgi:hypothetical protein